MQKNCGKCQHHRRTHNCAEVPADVREAHDCRENNHGLSSKAMEYRGAVMVCTELLDAGLRVVVFCSDDDSSMAAHLLEGNARSDMPPSFGVLRQVSDFSHRVRTFGSHVYKLAGKALKVQKQKVKTADGRSIEYQLDPEVLGDSRFSSACAAYTKRMYAAVLASSNLKSPTAFKAHMDVLLEHMFGRHEHCAEHFPCKAAKAVQDMADGVPGACAHVPNMSHKLVKVRDSAQKRFLVGNAQAAVAPPCTEAAGKQQQQPCSRQRNKGLEKRIRRGKGRRGRRGRGRSRRKEEEEEEDQDEDVEEEENAEEEEEEEEVDA